MKDKLDYNKLREWLMPLLEERQLSVEGLSRMVGLSRAAIYHYLTDESRPTTQNMAKICRVLGVSLEEGLRQYTPRQDGRPKGSKGYSGSSLPVQIRHRSNTTS